MVVLGLDRGLIVLRVRPRPGEEDLHLPGPLDDGLIEELSSVIEVQTGYRIRHFMYRRLQGGEDVGVGVVAHCAGPDPADMHIGEVQGAGELTFEGRPAVRDGIPLEEPRLRGDLIPSSADLDRITQQW